jgi:2-polyprenyl-6-hydroxyphenyl methylase/3-demethylubiquinone-9 3-methyltransferase
MKKKKYTGQTARSETDTFEADSMVDGIEFMQDDDYNYFFKITGLEGRTIKKINVLEVGCGSGPFGRRLAKKGFNVTGIDLSRVLVSAANRMAKKDKIKYRAVAGDAFEYKGKNYDIVLCAGFLHHFVDIKPIVKKMRDFLKKGGYVVSIEPNGSNMAVRMTEWVRKNVWPFNTMPNLGTLNETSHPVEEYLAEFKAAGYRLDNMQGFINKPKFHNYGILMDIILRTKYLLHAVTALFMPARTRGSVIVMKFSK